MSKKLLIFDSIVLLISLGVIIASNIIFGVTTLGILSSLATFFGIIYSLLAIGASKLTFYFGILNNAFFGAALIINKVWLLSAYALLFCIPLLVFRIITQIKKPSKEVPTLRHINKKIFLLLCVIQVVVVSGFMAFLYFVAKEQYWYLDAIGTSFLCISLLLLTTFYIESYIYFTLGNICNIILSSFLAVRDIQNITTLVMWVIYFISGVFGYFNWLRMYKQQQAALEHVTLSNEVQS
jgi:nicotinamide mononucleotide transporter PnuC